MRNDFDREGLIFCLKIFLSRNIIYLYLIRDMKENGRRPWNF